jgi:hypothetical protein
MSHNALIGTKKQIDSLRLMNNRGSLFLLGLLFYLLTSCMAGIDKTPDSPLPQKTLLQEGLAPASSSIDELCEEFLSRLAQKDGDELVALALTEAEFKKYYWPHTEWSRPEVRMPFEFYWGNHHQKSVVALNNMLAAFGGKQLNFMRVRFTKDTAYYHDAKVHVAPLLTVRDEEGKEWDLKFFGAVFELNGKYKIFSFN